MACHTVPQQPVAGHLVENQHQIFQLIKVYLLHLNLIKHCTAECICRRKLSGSFYAGMKGTLMQLWMLDAQTL